MGQSPERQKKELYELADDFENVMLCTVAADGSIHARPMIVAEIDPRGRWWFVTARQGGKVAELSHDAHATITMQSRAAFASLTGRARVVTDERSVKELWKPQFKAWFPRGPEDSEAVLICFEPEQGEYWERGMVDVVKLTAEKARAIMTGDSVDPKRAGDHGKVAFR